MPVSDPSPDHSECFRGLFYRKHGGGRPVIALHGFGATSYSWRHLVAALPAGIALYTFDLRGCGDSAKPHDEHYALRDQGAGIVAFIEEHDLNHVTLIGHSMGGGIALLVALDLLKRESRLHSLVLIDGIAFPQSVPWFMRIVRMPILGPFILASLPSKFMTKIVMRWAFYDGGKIDEQAVRDYARNLASPAARYAQIKIAQRLIPDDIDRIIDGYSAIKVPTLIVWGRDDRIVPWENAIRLQAALTHSRLLPVPDCGHIPHEERPQFVLPVISEFLKPPPR